VANDVAVDDFHLHRGHILVVSTLLVACCRLAAALGEHMSSSGDGAVVSGRKAGDEQAKGKQSDLDCVFPNAS
jgi:hypothetical protein